MAVNLPQMLSSLTHSPEWFYGIDLIIDIMSVIILLFIVSFAYKYYQLDKKRSLYSIVMAFSVLAVAFIVKVITHFSIYYNSLKAWNIELAPFLSKAVPTSEILFIIGFLLFRFLTLFGFYLLYFVYYPSSSKQTKYLLLFCLFIISYLTTSTYYVFHVIIFLLLTFISWQYYKKHFNREDLSTKYLLASYSMIAISQLLFIFIGATEFMYVIAEIVQLVGSGLLLKTFMQVLQYAKKH
ncbi:MAG: hypothetical protein KJ597_00750 [Nanoarchaeota archaeon]|nr:hypothetical protein [Nanoarchaeota archaeon]MBU1622080.1 hypothetical protein [Nanoarchaeota archaeon]